MLAAASCASSASRSLSTSFACWRASSLAVAAPMPRPAPVSTHTRPVSMPMTRGCKEVAPITA
eukprot:6010874-Pleurochrysis_carterae.AAC.3